VVIIHGWKNVPEEGYQKPTLISNSYRNLQGLPPIDLMDARRGVRSISGSKKREDILLPSEIIRPEGGQNVLVGSKPCQKDRTHLNSTQFDLEISPFEFYSGSLIPFDVYCNFKRVLGVGFHPILL
jgi:hypothetical protein